MSHLQPIYDVWGGNAEALATDIEELGVTVRQWRNRGDIPSRYWPKIIKAAAARGHAIALADFLSPEAKSDLPGHAIGDTADGVAGSDGGPGVPHGPFVRTSSGMNLSEAGQSDNPFPSSTGTAEERAA
jgi:hypothetical protein